jgi:hypothetical protein
MRDVTMMRVEPVIAGAPVVRVDIVAMIEMVVRPGEDRWAVPSVRLALPSRITEVG